MPGKKHGSDQTERTREGDGRRRANARDETYSDRKMLTRNRWACFLIGFCLSPRSMVTTSRRIKATVCLWVIWLVGLNDNTGRNEKASEYIRHEPRAREAQGVSKVSRWRERGGDDCPTDRADHHD